MISAVRQLTELIQRRSHTFLRVVGVVGILVGWGAMYFFDDWDGLAFWVTICVATVLSALGAWGGLAEQWGYKPISNDPLGWRAAKKSYDQPHDQQMPGKIDKDPPKS